MTKIIFSFDTEDYVDRPAADMILRHAEILRGHRVRGCFNVVGWLAESLEKWDRVDVIDALKYHEIDTHSLSHSYHPTINEYTDIADYEAARAIFLRNEKEGNEILRRVFGIDEIPAACPPGNCVSYVAHYGWAELGHKVFDGDLLIDAVRNRPVGYCNMLSLHYTSVMEQRLIHVDGDRHIATEEELKNWLDEIAQYDVYILSNHPNRAMYAKHWDDVNFYGENTPAEQWKEPERIPTELTDAYFRLLDELIRMIQADSRFQTVTYGDIARENSEPRAIRRADLQEIGEQIAEEFFPVTLPDSFCLSDIFHACHAFLCGEEVFPCGTVYGFLEEPFAVSSPVTVTAEEVRRGAEKIPAGGFLPLKIQAGSHTLGPADWMRAALRVINGEDTVLVEPAPWQIDLGQFPMLKDLSLRKNWVNVKDMEDRYVSNRNRLQSWTIRLPKGSCRKIY